MRRLSQAFAVCAAFLVPAIAQAAEIKLIASNAVKEAYEQLLPAYEKASGNKVTVTWGGTADIMKSVNDGAPADIVLITDFGIDGLVKSGKLVSAGSTVVAKSPVGVAVPAGAKKPDISSAAALKASLLASKSVAFTGGPSNAALYKMLDTLGIAEAMKAKKVRTERGPAFNNMIITGEADIAFSQASELFSVKGLDYIGTLPKGAEIVLTYVAAYHAKAAQPEAAKALVKFLTTQQAAQVLKKTALEPG